MAQIEMQNDETADRAGRTLVGVGIAGMVLLLGLMSADGASRSDGYDAVRHWISLLSHGDRGWLGSVNFATSGVLLLVSSWGVHQLGRRRAMSSGIAVAVACFGAALLVAAAFPIDATASYPRNGSPPEVVSLSGRVHAVAGVVLIGSLAAACLLGARDFDRRGLPWARWASWWCGSVMIGGFVLCGTLVRISGSGSWEAAGAGAFQRCALVVGGGWLSCFAVWLLRSGPGASQKSVLSNSKTSCRT